MRHVWLLTMVAALLAAPATAGPQHWGFGFGYFVTIEEDDAGHRALSVYEPPLRVKDSQWLLRWRDTSDQYGQLLPNGAAIGNFWPEGIGEEQLVLIERDADRKLVTRVLAAPDVFSNAAWQLLGTPGIHGPYIGGATADTIIAAAAGDVLGRGFDQLVLLEPFGNNAGFEQVVVYAPPTTPGDGEWRVIGKVPVPPLGHAAAMAVSGFWGHDRAQVALLMRQGNTHDVVYLEINATAGNTLTYRLVARETLTNMSRQPTCFIGEDFLKDGFAYLALGSPSTSDLAFRVAPRREQLYDTPWVRADETFAGAKLTGQQLGEGRQIMTAQRQAPFGKLVAAAAGRIFGYVVTGCDERKETFWKSWVLKRLSDVEISFAERTPLYRLGVPKKWQDGNWPWEPDDHYGWPHKGEEVTYRVHIKNNGKDPIEGGRITLRAWVDTPDRNADTLPNSASTVSFTTTLEDPLPPFDPANPQYAIVDIKFPWPFDLIQPPGWTWKKINVREIGERWLVMRLDYHDDQNARNDRYEMALNALLLRPVYRDDDEVNTLAFRAPTVLGDPESKEYITRKLADAVQCMWERSRTSTGDDVWQRVAFVGYRLGWPCNREQDWSYFEGPRELQKWIGLWGDFERFNPHDGGAELHETCHLFQRIGDLYHYYVFPTSTRRIHMADGAPVQVYTYAWARDSYSDGFAILGEGTCDLHRYVEGVRYGLGWPWHRMLPDKVFVRVLDRDGLPIPSAKVTRWSCSPHVSNEESAGVTESDGRWDTGLPCGTVDTFEPLGLPLYNDPVYDALSHIFTVDLDGYSDFAVLGAEDVNSHSRYALMAHSLTDRAGWTWDMHTLYKPGAPKPTFGLAAAVRERNVVLRIESRPAATYRLYRRWEPTYNFELIAERVADEEELVFQDDMGTADWFTHDRYRATYYVTESIEGVESLPRRVYGMAITRASGLSDLGAGRLLVTTNAGKAEPFVMVMNETAPAEELIKHFRFGHTARRVVASIENPQRYYATLSSADLPDDERSFDLIQFDKPDRFQNQYPVLQAIATAEVKSFSADRRFSIELAAPDTNASTAINVGDVVINAGRADRRSRVSTINGNTLELEEAIFDKGQSEGLRVNIEFGGGRPGRGKENRELRDPRGLATLRAGDAEFVAIADTGNDRLVVWNSTTRFVAQWQTKDWHPVAVARHPEFSDRCFVLSRNADGNSRLYLLKLDGQRLSPERGYPVPVRVREGEDGTEMGLAAAIDPRDGRVVVAVTDATRRLVYEMKFDLLQWKTIATHGSAIGAVAGPERLINPTDVAYSLVAGELELFALDDHNRVVRLR
ncbi:MAG: hypothetical protein JXO22_06410 [Phycisphaerae bacterium]|nr:hypothetical protein [Phycisphaerae bacterium]